MYVPIRNFNYIFIRHLLFYNSYELNRSIVVYNIIIPENCIINEGVLILIVDNFIHLQLLK